MLLLTRGSNQNTDDRHKKHVNWIFYILAANPERWQENPAIRQPTNREENVTQQPMAGEKNWPDVPRRDLECRPCCRACRRCRGSPPPTPRWSCSRRFEGKRGTSLPPPRAVNILLANCKCTKWDCCNCKTYQAFILRFSKEISNMYGIRNRN